MLQALNDHRFVVQDPGNRRYQPGLRLFELAHQVIAKLTLRGVAEPEIKTLSCQIDETVHLAVLDDGDVVYVDKQETQRTIRMYSAIGKRAPSHCTGLGKVFLAHMPQEELECIVRTKGLKVYTSNTIATLPELKRDLAMVREKGYAIDDAEHEPDVRCAAAPIRDSTGRVVAAVSVAVPSIRASREQIEGMAHLVKRVAERISRKMGCVGQGSTSE